MTEQIKKIIIEVIEEQKREFSLDFDVAQDTPFIGDDSVFDSIELLSFITELEIKFEIEYDQEVLLVNEESFSFAKSPFLSLEKLINHMESILKI